MKRVLFLVCFLSISSAEAAPVPPERLPLITLRLDIRNLTGPGNEGGRTEAELSRPIEGVNEIWRQCGIRFAARETVNVSAERFNIPYRPASQEDLGRIAEALNPEGFARADALPLTYAGPWRFFDGGTGVFPTGLGWVFVNADGTLNRIGAMVDATKPHGQYGAEIVGHELGHALSLPDNGISGNLMCGGSPAQLTADQCAQARSFARSALLRFVAGEEIASTGG